MKRAGAVRPRLSLIPSLLVRYAEGQGFSLAFFPTFFSQSEVVVVLESLTGLFPCCSSVVVVVVVSVVVLELPGPLSLVVVVSVAVHWPMPLPLELVPPFGQSLANAGAAKLPTAIVATNKAAVTNKLMRLITLYPFLTTSPPNGLPLKPP